MIGVNVKYIFSGILNPASIEILQRSVMPSFFVFVFLFYFLFYILYSDSSCGLNRFLITFKSSLNI